MPIEAVKIPQNVYVEDRIFGPVTLKQLMISGVGAGIGYMGFAISSQAGLGIAFQVVSWVPTVIAVAFAFLKINDLSLFSIILLWIESMNKPHERYWSSHGGLSINLITKQATQDIDVANTKIADNASRLADITRQMEKRQEAMDHLAAHEIQRPEALEPIKTKLAMAGAPKETTDTVTGPVTESSLPVNQQRVKSDGLKPELSIDGISDTILAFEKLTSKAS